MEFWNFQNLIYVYQIAGPSKPVNDGKCVVYTEDTSDDELVASAVLAEKCGDILLYWAFQKMKLMPLQVQTHCVITAFNPPKTDEEMDEVAKKR